MDAGGALPQSFQGLYGRHNRLNQVSVAPGSCET
jgi:hypothetical protein